MRYAPLHLWASALYNASTHDTMKRSRWISLGSLLLAFAARPAPIPADVENRVASGRLVYESACMACHQGHGQGVEGWAPPLAGSEWVAGSDKRIALIVMSGLRGPVVVRKKKYDLDMPAFTALSDRQIADVLTYVRRAWGHEFAPVKLETVSDARKAGAQREDPWSAAELQQIK